MRRTGLVLALALVVAAGCAVRPETVPGAAAPLTGTGAPAPPPTTPTAARSSPASSTTSPTGSPLPPVPADFSALRRSGFGVAVSMPAPNGWARKPSSSAGLIRTEVDLENPQVLLRIDLSDRVAGSAMDFALGNEAGTKLPDYRRIGITPVDGVGDDAVDWTFTFVRDGTRQVVDRQILAGTAAIAVYYSAPAALYERYLPVWQRAIRDLTIETS